MAKSFSSSIGNRSNLLVIDGFNLSFRYKYAKKKNFGAHYLQTVMSFAQSYNASEVIVLSDGGSNYREGIFPEYKIDRKIARKDDTEQDKADFKAFMDDWIMAFELCGTMYPTIRYKGVEADDIAAYIALDKRILEKFSHVWLLSTDKDWDLLVTDQVSRFSYKTRKEVTIDNFQETYGYEPYQHISVKAIQGDSGDSVPGVEGIGPKRAAELVKAYGSAYDIHASLPIADKKVYIQNLNNFGDQILLNYELMDLVEYCGLAVGDNLEDLNSRIGEIVNK
tara:strand:+ start:605 stop:1444 length:840 start_codon:yes stop_codon:yes gene_type:complete